jgi:hypothetical protein
MDVAATVEQFRAIGDSVGIPQANSRGEIAAFGGTVMQSALRWPIAKNR